MDARELREWEEEGFERLTRIGNGYAELENGHHIYGGYIYDMVTQTNVLYENIYLDGAFLAASCNSPFTQLIEKRPWVCFAIIDPYGIKGEPFLHVVHKSFMFKFKEIETKLWDTYADLKYKRGELIRMASDSIQIRGKETGIHNEIRQLEENINKYEKMLGEE